MSRPSVESFSEHIATGWFASEVVTALGEVEAGGQLGERDRQVLEEASRLLADMADPGCAMKSRDPADLRRQLDLFEVAERGREPAARLPYVRALADALGRVVSEEAPVWDEDLEEAQDFFSVLGNYELARTSQRFIF